MLSDAGFRRPPDADQSVEDAHPNWFRRAAWAICARFRSPLRRRLPAVAGVETVWQA
jgi:hypothetical protein